MPILICFVIFLCSEARLRCAECLESPEETCLKTPKFSACGGLISRSRASIESTSQLKKFVVLANSIPVATWTLSTWRDFRKIPRAFNRVCCLFVLCFVNVDGFIMPCVYFCFFGLKPLITPSSNSSCIAWYILLLYTNLKKCSNSVVSSNIQTRVPFSIVSSFCVWIFFTHTFAVCWTKSS